MSVVNDGVGLKPNAIRRHFGSPHALGNKIALLIIINMTNYYISLSLLNQITQV